MNTYQVTTKENDPCIIILPRGGNFTLQQAWHKAKLEANWLRYNHETKKLERV